MGFWDIFKRSKKNYNNSKSELPVFEHNIKVSSSEFEIHPDIKNLIWIENGPQKNYYPDKTQSKSTTYNNIAIKVSIFKSDEPSLIDTHQKVKKIKNLERVEVPPYFPSYSELKDDQKYVYWNFLSNPYQKSYNIGYVFILYYGLERHLFEGDFQQAAKVILKLREVYKNKSFQHYSGNALVMSCLIQQRADIMFKFIYSLDESYKKEFSVELFLLGIHSFDIPLLPKDIMRLAQSVEFRKKNYIKDYPDLFEKTMEKILLEKYSKPHVLIKEIQPDLQNLSIRKMRVFANISLIDEGISIPDLLSSQRIVKELYNTLEQSHESVKKQLVEYRKNNIVPTKQTQPKQRQAPAFDYKEEARLLDELKTYNNNPVSKHFTFNSLIDFYYKYRELDDAYIEKCIEYCKEDIDNLNIMQEAYVQGEIKRLSSLKSIYSKNEYDIEVRRIKQEKFTGNIPAFKRLSIIYEKRKEYKKALNVSEQAFKYYSNLGIATDGFEKRIEKLEKKIKSTS